MCQQRKERKELKKNAQCIPQPVSPFYSHQSSDFYSSDDSYLNAPLPSFCPSNQSPNYTIFDMDETLYMDNSSYDQLCPTESEHHMSLPSEQFGTADMEIDHFNLSYPATQIHNIEDDVPYSSEGMDFDQVLYNLDQFSINSNDTHALDMYLRPEDSESARPLPDDLLTVSPWTPPGQSDGLSVSPDVPQFTADQALQKITTGKRGKRLRHPKSWEFLLRLLTSPATNPSLIKWEDRERGIFRLVDKDQIARFWGSRTDKHKDTPLSYENFARVLRFHYKSGHLRAVNEKHLVYQFGDKVIQMLKENNQM